MDEGGKGGKGGKREGEGEERESGRMSGGKEVRGRKSEERGLGE